MSMPLTVLCSTAPHPEGVDKPGGRLPYGLGRLEDRFDLRWVRVDHGGRAARRVRRRVDGAIRRLSPGRRGWEIARAARREASSAVLSIFEDAGLAYARRAPRTSAHVMVSCWLAQDIRDSPSAGRSLRTSLSSVSALCVFSANQPEILSTELGFPAERIRVVPFGVDTDYFDPARMDRPGGGGGVVAVGSDSRRDYATLFAVSERTGIPMTVACQPRNLRGLTVPRGVRLVSVFDGGYRDLLHGADVVVTPTTAPAYPSGQTVLLEAMSMATATITTDSLAVRDYVADGVNGLLSPAGDVDALADRVVALLEHDALRASLARRAAVDVRDRFTLGHQWDAVGAVIDEVSR